MDKKSRFDCSLRIYLKDRKKGSTDIISTGFEFDEDAGLDKNLQEYREQILRTITFNDSHKVECFDSKGGEFCKKSFDSVEEMTQHRKKEHSKRAIARRQKAFLQVQTLLA